MNIFTYVLIALAILYIFSFLTKKITKLLLYSFVVFFIIFFIIEFSKKMYDRLKNNTNETDDDDI